MFQNVKNFVKKIAVFGYNTSAVHFIAPNSTEDVKAAYTYGAWVGLASAALLFNALRQLED